MRIINTSETMVTTFYHKGQLHQLAPKAFKDFPDTEYNALLDVVKSTKDLTLMMEDASDIESLSTIQDIKNYMATLNQRITALENPVVTDIAVLPVSGNVVIPTDGSLIVEVAPEGQDFYVLEIDHSLQGVLPEFSLYASEANPFGSQQAQDQAQELGFNATYSQAEGKWVLDFGKTITDIFKSRPSVTFHFVVKDALGNTIWGSMSPTTPENTRTYNITE